MASLTLSSSFIWSIFIAGVSVQTHAAPTGALGIGDDVIASDEGEQCHQL